MASLQRDEADRQFRNRQLDMAEREEGRLLAQENASRVLNLARELGVADTGRAQLDTEALTTLLDEQRASGRLDSRVNELAVLLGNQDLATQQNPGFSWRQFQIGPNNTLTMSGTYEGEGENRFVTEGRSRDPQAQVAFSTPQEIANLMGNQFNQVWNQPGVASLRNELYLKNDLIDANQSIQENEDLIAGAVGQLTNEVEAAILQYSGENGPALTQRMKQALAGLPYQDQLTILRDYADGLQINTAEIVTPEVEAATAEAAQPSDDQPSGDQPLDEGSLPMYYGAPPITRSRPASPQSEPAADPPADVASLEARLAAIEGKTGRGFVDRRKELQRQLEEARGGNQRATPAASAGNAPPIQDENPEIQATARAAEAATDEEIAAGQVRVTPEGIAALKERLQARDITTLEEMNRATRAEQQYMRAMLSTLAANEEQRATYLDRMNNVMATGSVDFDSKTLGEAILAERTEDRQAFEAETARQTSDTGRLNYFQRVLEHDWKVSEAVGGRIRDIFSQARTAIYGRDRDGNPNTDIKFDRDRFFSEFGSADGAFTQMYREYLNAQGEETKSQTRLALNSMISMGIQALAQSEDYGTFLENFLPDGEIDHIDSNDVYLDRLIITPEGRLAVIDRSTGAQVDETIPAGVLRNLFGETGWAYVKREIEGGPNSARGRARNNAVVD